LAGWWFRPPLGQVRISGTAKPLALLRAQGFKVVRASGNAPAFALRLRRGRPDPGTDLVRCGV
jgi:hypothetical protein